MWKGLCCTVPSLKQWKSRAQFLHSPTWSDHQCSSLHLWCRRWSWCGQVFKDQAKQESTPVPHLRRQMDTPWVTTRGWNPPRAKWGVCTVTRRHLSMVGKGHVHSGHRLPQHSTKKWNTLISPWEFKLKQKKLVAEMFYKGHTLASFRETEDLVLIRTKAYDRLISGIFLQFDMCVCHFL